MSMSHFAITTLQESPTEVNEHTDLTEWAQTVLLFESQKPRRSGMINLRTLAASRILPLTLTERELLQPKGKNQ